MRQRHQDKAQFMKWNIQIDINNIYILYTINIFYYKGKIFYHRKQF